MKVSGMRKVILIITLLISGCAKNPHPEHLLGVSCPKPGHGKCPFGCDD